MSKPLYLILFSALTLTACGGSSSDNSGNPEVPLPDLGRCNVSSTLNVNTTDSGLIFLTEPSYQVGQPSTLIGKIGNQDSRQHQYFWQQTAGPTLELTNQRSPIFSFEASSSGEYQFELTVTSTGQTYSESIPITVTDETPVLRLRNDHQVVQGNNVSVRIDRINGDVPSALSWCVAAGPNISLDLSNNERALFTVPNVPADTVSIIRATAQVDGQSVSDDVHLLITKEAPITSTFFEEPVARTFAYNSDSPYAQTLQRCVYSNQLTSLCNINQLPLIGQLNQNLDNQLILDRVLVSHQWMGDNFAEFLTSLDPNSDFARLLQSVTAVVISYDIRPSFYWVATGAIYLDPNDLWLTKFERDTINEAPDYRSGFGSDLNFLMPWRYVKDNQYTSYLVSREQRVDRNWQAAAPDFASLLLHELAHANDFFPRSSHALLQGPRLYDDYLRRSDSKLLVSDQLEGAYPLVSQEMFSLADVRFRGESASETQKSYQPNDISQFFSNDRASDFYAYSTTREDAAMLFEEAMMSHRYQIQRDVGVTDYPANATASSIVVDWGQRGRIGQVELADRAVLVIDRILPELNAQQWVANLPIPIAMRTGETWQQNLSLTTQQTVSTAKAKQTSPSTLLLAEPPLQLSGDRHKQ
ncbi:PKD domain-containing protein [Shewanella colwelliana]|uniref:PKD domain-containing protein n=1 Tax=Shewanella colwelliana TaxID=23 RepID=UPI00299EF38A|nr:hypothetical protein [Shewanella colwelliana]MDX1280972.1 hypothetical protein [Shewanella colwelliana]